MKTVMYERFGGPDVLRLTESAIPEPGPGQARIRVAASGVNPIDGKIRSGAMESAFHTPLPSVPGVEVAGTVDAVGSDVSGVRPGDEVLGYSDTGSYAEFALASTMVAKPASIGWEAAAALPVAGTTAVRVLRLLGATAGETLLIHGASGSVGAVAAQLASADGVRVIGTAGPGNQDYVASRGAIPTTYGPGLVDRVRALAPEGVDAVFDAAGKGALPDSIELRGGVERIVTIADPEAGRLGVRFSSGGAEDRSTDLMTRLAERVASGALRLSVAATFPLAEAAAAQRSSETDHRPGKVVITVA